jgi:hypothetical protein
MDDIFYLWGWQPAAGVVAGLVRVSSNCKMQWFTTMLSPEFHRGGIFLRGSTGIPPHLDHTLWYCPPEGGVWIPLVVVLQVEYSTKKLPGQSMGKTTKIPLMLQLQETNSCVRAIQSRLQSVVVRAADTTKKW